MDSSQHYHSLLKKPEPVLNNEELLEFRNRYQVVLLKGFFGDLLPERFDSYFFDQMRWMRDHDIAHCRLEPTSGYGTQKLPENNIEAIENEVLSLHQKQPDKPVVIVSHSKGGIDALEMLLRRKNLIDREIIGWIAIQAPFWGTPVANWAIDNRLFNPIIEQLLGGLLKGDRKVAACMSVEARKNYMTQNAEAISELTAKLNILNFATSCTAGDASLFTPLRFAIDKICKVTNDGLLPTQSEILKVDGTPCCPFIETQHIDHIYAVLPLNPDKKTGPTVTHKTRRIQIFSALLKVWMSNRKNL